MLRIPDALALNRAADVTRFMADCLSEGTIEVGTQARWVATQLLYPPLSDPTRPAAWLTRLVALGPLPPAIRAAYGFPWTARHERSLRIATGAIRRLVRILPPVARYWKP